MFKRKKRKTGTQIPLQYNSPPMPPVKPPKPPTSGSNAVKPNPNYVPPASAKKSCPYETPCGWCTKWDKKCDKKIGCEPEGEFIIEDVPCKRCAKFIFNNFRGCVECNGSNGYKYFIEYIKGVTTKENTK